MAKLRQLIFQIFFYAVFILLIGYYSSAPRYVHHDPAQALIKLSFNHAGERKEKCRRLSQEELLELAPNMRKPLACKRERVPVYVEIFLDHELLFKDTLMPGGLSRDGTSSVYQRFVVAAGEHHLLARLRDNRDQEGFDFIKESIIDVKPMQSLTINFNDNTGGFTFL